MPNRPAKFASAILVSLLAGASLATLPHTGADAAEGCLSEPKAQTPEGMHWYYRIDHATQRHCWYMRGEGEASQEASPDQSSAPKTTAPKSEAATQRSIADAHAELSMPQGGADRSAGVPAAPRTQTIWPDAASALNDPRANSQSLIGAQSTVASRWPEPSGVGSTADPQPATSDQIAEASDAPTMAPSPAPAPVAPAAADVPPVKATASLQTLAMVIVGALALAGLTVSLIFRLSKAWHRSRANARRRAIWQSANGTREPPWADEAPHHSARHRELSPRPDSGEDPNQNIDRVTEFLELLSKQARADADKLRSRNRASEFPAGERS